MPWILITGYLQRRDQREPGTERFRFSGKMSIGRVAQAHLFVAGFENREGPLILRRLREQFQRGFWRMPGPTV
jgi:hypothetical protein